MPDNLPALPAIHGEDAPATFSKSPAISLAGRDYHLARAVPGAVYSTEQKCMVLPVPTPRAAIVALTLFPDLAGEYPELVELRAELLQDVKPTDFAAQYSLAIEAPTVHALLKREGHDWLTFADGQRQDTDLGYIAAQLTRLGGGYLGWARGYGKTLGTAAIIEANGYERVLVAAPNTAKLDVWQTELARFLPFHQVLIMGNTPRHRERVLERTRELSLADRPFVLVVHHEALAIVAGTQDRPSGKGKTVLNGWAKAATATGFDLFAFDEGHRLANPDTQLHRAACKVPSGARLCLSGSVYQNSWEELYGPLHWLFPKQYRAKWPDWNNRFLDYVEGYGKICVGVLPGKEQAMRDELGVFMVVREKPDRSEHRMLRVALGPTQRRAYDELRDELVTELEDGTLVAADAGVVALTRLRQIATGLELLSHRVVDSSKLDAATQLISDRPDDEFFVACWYKASAYALAERLRDTDANPMTFVITGDVPQAKRRAILDQSRDCARRGIQVVLIGTIPTLGESVNLQHLNHVVRLDRSFNPALNRQVVDRCDRTGQTRQVYCTDIVAADTVDELVVLPNLANKDAFRALILGRPA